MLRLNFYLKVESEVALAKTLKAQKATEGLLLNILPQSVVEKLKDNPGVQIAEDLPSSVVMFCSICNFEKLTQKTSIWLLNDIICDMDELCHEYGVEKVKTIGTKYMAMSEPDDAFVENHLTRMAVFALNLQEFIKAFSKRTNQNFGYFKIII
jgi:hypothetical protein